VCSARGAASLSLSEEVEPPLSHTAFAGPFYLPPMSRTSGPFLFCGAARRGSRGPAHPAAPVLHRTVLPVFRSGSFHGTRGQNVAHWQVNPTRSLSVSPLLAVAWRGSAGRSDEVVRDSGEPGSIKAARRRGGRKTNKATPTGHLRSSIGTTVIILARTTSQGALMRKSNEIFVIKHS